MRSESRSKGLRNGSANESVSCVSLQLKPTEMAGLSALVPVTPAPLQREGRRRPEDRQEAHGQLAGSVHVRQREKQLETLCLSVGGGGESNPKSPLTPTHTPSYSHVYLNVGDENTDVGWVPWHTVWRRAGTHCFFSSQEP